MQDIWANIFGFFLTPEVRLWPLYIVSMLLICAVIYWKRRQTGSFLAWVFPREIYLHKSHILDLKLFVMSRAMAFFGLLNVVATGAITATFVSGILDFNVIPFHPVLVAALLLIAADFGVYWVHRIHHETKILWPFHSLHHSAEVMTPVTVYRKHPIYDVISAAVKGVS